MQGLSFEARSSEHERTNVSNGRIKGAMPCFHRFRCPRYAICRIKVMVPHADREQCLQKCTTWECTSDIGPLEVLYNHTEVTNFNLNKKFCFKKKIDVE